MKSKLAYLLLASVYSAIAILLIANRTFNFLAFTTESDYIRYIERADNPTLSDTPIIYVLIRLYALIFTPYFGVCLLGFMCGTLVLFFFMSKFYMEDRLMMFIFLPLILIGNLAFRWNLNMLKSLIGFSTVIFASLYEKGSRKINIAVIIVSILTYYPSAIYYAMYKTMKRENLKEIYLSLILLTPISLLLSQQNLNWSSNIVKTLQIISPIRITNYYTEDPIITLPNFYGWDDYMLMTSPILCIAIYDYYKTKNRESLFWVLLYLLPYIPYRGLWLSKRLMWISWVPMTMILYHTMESLYKTIGTTYITMYLIHILTYRGFREIMPILAIMERMIK